MKKLLAFLFCTSAFCCCTDSITDDLQQELAEVNATQISENHQVTYSDVLKLSTGANIETRSSIQAIPKIKCITNNANDTVLYVNIKPLGGWTIYSSDTRVPAIIAQSENGSFEELMQIDGAKLWIQSIAEDMAVIKNLSEESLNFTKEDIARNKSFWESISSPDKYVKENILPATRSGRLLFIPGHYEYSHSTSYTEVYDSIPRKIETDWHQYYPYNEYCPLQTTGTLHAPAGCVAIAGAQMLYFLHKTYGVPATAPSEAYCVGNINSYTWAQTNYTSDIWDSMSKLGIYAAPLIADVGRRLGMEYGDSLSGAIFSDLTKKVFEPYGISCTYANYNTDNLKKSLLDEIPVLLSARSTHTTSTGTEKVGHAFIADRYKRTRTVTKLYYEWVYEPDSTDTPIPMVPDKIEYSYSSPVINMIGINWGWGYSYNKSDEWFSLTGDWISSSSDMSGYNWNIDRKMIYGFQIIND